MGPRDKRDRWGDGALATSTRETTSVRQQVLLLYACCHGSAGTPRPTLSWLEGVNTNAYYFVDVVTTNCLAPIYFTGDRESRLGNPVVVARAFETKTVVNVALQAEFTARDNPCNTRHTYGVGEKVHLTATPALSAIMYRVLKADVTDIATPYDTVRDGNISGRITEVDASQERLYICPATSTAPDLTVSFGEVQYRPVMTMAQYTLTNVIMNLVPIRLPDRS